MQVRNSLHNCQPDSGPLEVGFAVQTLEHAKQFISVTHVKAGPVVGNVEAARRGIVSRTNLNLRLIGLARELAGVTNQILQNDLQQSCIGLN